MKRAPDAIEERPDEGGGLAGLAGSALAQFARMGYDRYPPEHVRASSEDSTLFISAGIQIWRSWALGEGAAGQARVGAQWCVRTNHLLDLDQPAAATSFCMISAVRLGRRDRGSLIGDTLSVLDRCGMPRSRLGFIVSGADEDRPCDEESLSALAALGVDSKRVAVRPRRWSWPFRPIGPTGPNLYLLAQTREPCSAQCSPLCPCGRFLNFWNCEFLDHVRDPQGALGPAPMPVADMAGSVERLACAIAGTASMWDTDLLRPAARDVRALLDQAGAGTLSAHDAFGTLLDHGRTVALLVGSGVVGGSKGHGHVLRRLIRRMLAIMTVHEVPLQLAAPVIETAARASVGCQGFPSVTEVAAWRPLIDAEVAAFAGVIARGRVLHQRELLQRRSDRDLAEAMFRIKSQHGVPMALLLSWSRAAGRDIPGDQLAALLSDERAVSRHRGTDSVSKEGHDGEHC